jgi:hypothetical protein
MIRKPVRVVYQRGLRSCRSFLSPRRQTKGREERQGDKGTREQGETSKLAFILKVFVFLRVSSWEKNSVCFCAGGEDFFLFRQHAFARSHLRLREN